MNRRFSTLLSATLVSGVALFAFNVNADDFSSKFSQTLVSLRDDVDRLSRSLEDQKGEQRAELRALNAQKSDLEIQVQREEAQIKALRAAIERRQVEVDKANTNAATLSPMLLKSIGEIEATISTGLPFKQTERLAELDKLKKAVTQKSIPETRAVGRVWQFVEDEIRLTKENGLYKQPIQIDGEEVLAEVARIGMVAMYFRTDDGTVGHAVQKESGWSFETLTDEEDVAEVSYLFEAFRKQIRAGAFDLPGDVLTGGQR